MSQEVSQVNLWGQNDGKYERKVRIHGSQSKEDQHTSNWSSQKERIFEYVITENCLELSNDSIF